MMNRDDVYERIEYYLEGADFDKVLRYSNRLLKINPNDVDALDFKYKAYKNLEEYDKALECIDRIMELKPELTGYFNDKAYIYEDCKNYDKAIQMYDTSIEVNEDNLILLHNAYIGKGRTYKTMGKMNDALQVCDEWINIVENNSHEIEKEYSKKLKYNFYALKGNVLKELERYEEAVKIIDKAIKCKPALNDDYDSYDLTLNKASILKKLGRVKEVEKCYNKILKKDPKNIDANLGKVELLIDKGEKDKVLKYIKTGVKSLLRVELDIARFFNNTDIIFDKDMIYHYNKNKIEQENQDPAPEAKEDEEREELIEKSQESPKKTNLKELLGEKLYEKVISAGISPEDIISPKMQDDIDKLNSIKEDMQTKLTEPD